ncbi:muscle-specific protein 20 isoform X14 [Nasonia vitripennis]|uniref:Transgelin n=1 Tax=Nasonia vitripennis TaxID=7425 RepID=A0A7M7QXL9_NASVI|nr:muscle-specific protein 20 isoform X14 [Nasonia vitripennis]
MALERQVHAKILAKRDPEQEREAQEWIESIIGNKFPAGLPIEDVLKDGVVLCELMNKIKPGSINKVNTSGGEFKMMENINKFQKALKEYGVSDVDVFQTVDLWEKKNIAQVVTTLFALGRETYRHPEFQGPNLGPKPADECKRDFSEEQLKAGQTVIGLQAGSNKGATQAGQNMGASRKILLGK